MIRQGFNRFARILRDIDERDAGAPAPDNSTDDILSIFKMDFEDSAQEPQAQEPAVAPVPSSEPVAPNPESSNQCVQPEVPSVEPAVEPVSEPQKAPQPAGPSTEELLAKAMEVNQKLASQLEQKKAISEEPSQPEEDEDTKVFAPKKFEDYTFNINPKLYEGLFSADATQDERVQCLQAYASGIATTVHNRVLESLGQWTRQNFEAVPRVVQMMIAKTQQSDQTTNQIRQEFYTKYPDLQRQELYPLLKATIQTVQKETKTTAWTSQFADQVASRVRNVLAGYAQASKPKAAAPIMTPAAAKPAPQVKETDPNGAEEIFATLSNEF